MLKIGQRYFKYLDVFTKKKEWNVDLVENTIICDALRFGTFCITLKCEKNRGEVLILGKLQAEACNFNKSNTPTWVFFTIFRL